MKKDLLFLIWWIVLISGIVVRWVMGKDTEVTSNTPNTAWTVPTQNNLPAEVIAVGHDWRSLVPEQIVLVAWKSYDIQVTPSRNGVGCMFAATIPTLWTETWTIKSWETFSIKIDNAKSGTYPVVCTSMGMRQGEIIVKA